MRLRNSRRAALAALATISFAGVGAGVASATTPPSEPTEDTAMTSDAAATGSSVDETDGSAAAPTGPLCAAIRESGAAATTTGTMAPTDTMASSDTMSDGTMASGDTMSDGTMATTGADTGAGSSMTDSPVATAASMNPLLTVLTSAIEAAGLTDTLDSGEAFTVLAPVDSAFAKLDPITIDAAMADPSGLLASILSYHVIPEQLSSEDLASGGSFESVLGEELTFEMRQDTLIVNDGEAAVQCMDIPTANATVFLIDTVLVPPSVDSDAGATSTTAGSTTGSTPAATDVTDTTASDAGASDTGATTVTTGG